MPLAKRLKELRKIKKISQRKLASLLNISPGTVGMYETSKREPDYEMLSRIADLFCVTTDYLLGRTDDPTPPQKQDKPAFEKYVLDVRTLAEASLRIAELINDDQIDEEEYLRLNKLAYRKFGLPPAKGADKAAHLKNKAPASGVFEE